MHETIQAVILGLLTGGVYALMASGQTLIFGVLKVVNLAQGALVILAAYLSSSLFDAFGIDPFLTVLLVAPAMFLLGTAVQWCLLRPLHRSDAPQLSLLVTFAVALGIEGVLTLVYKSDYRSIQPGYVNRSWTVAGYQVGEVRLAACLLSLATLGALALLLGRTRFGRAVRATVQNPTAARLLGVESGRVAALGFGLGAATAAAAGAVYGMVYSFNPGSHYDLISRLLSIVVLGGLGSLGGTVIAALAMGVVSALVGALVSPVWSDFSFFVVLLAVLLVRPGGLFGARLRGAL
ncbi:branched-chain amino acid ABC transporter permease [Streptacidiphilus carbonis]|uniref:branched-chain amino acid ABC transporter permease n=1 Tax=Streptacidiphilus carbonis TaxID=105422 RepID=UPI0005AB0E33|nr:branched-chain amino acid ABC transporter permease [Streptacidiphilus carbonis]